MPTYEYECQSCNYRFEKFQSMTAKPIQKCPKCSKSKVKRLIGAGAGIIFKGSGFYATDYRKCNKKEEDKKQIKDSNSCSSCKSSSSGCNA